MISYKDNPNLKFAVKVTVNGEKEYRRNCRYINKKYHIINKDCFFINGVWYTVSEGKIVFDYEKKEWVLKNSGHLIEGVVGIDEDGNPITGYFTPNIYNNVRLFQVFGTCTAINSQILIDNGYVEDIANNTWYSKKVLDPLTYKKITKIRLTDNSFAHKGYNIEDNVAEFELKKQSYHGYNIPMSKDVRRYAKLLGGISWGCEIETSAGNMPANLEYRHGLVACRDGSIGQEYKSAEWVTVPMTGAKGLQNTATLMEEIKKRCDIDINCSLHIHIGNIPTDRAYVIALYTLFYKIQDELFEMFPYYKTNPQGFKHKNYCQKLRKMGIHPLKDTSKEGYKNYVDELYYRIFTFLADGVPPSQQFNKKMEKHPVERKWERHSRYHAINLEPLILSKRKTAEFRLHEGTTNPQKTLNWLFICAAIVNYAKQNTFKIFMHEGKIKLNDVLDYYKNTFKTSRAILLSEYLKAYVQSRRDLFKEDYNKGDYLSNHFAKNDKNYKFTYGNIDYLF